MDGGFELLAVDGGFELLAMGGGFEPLAMGGGFEPLAMGGGFDGRSGACDPGSTPASSGWETGDQGRSPIIALKNMR
jgi:hypothetical protein